MRFHYLDALRSVLMCLGIVFHAALIYDQSAHWLVSDGDAAYWRLFHAMQALIHGFRMPAFFIISGFFCLMALRKYAGAEFLKVRLVRVVVPLLSVALLFNASQAYIVYLHHGGTGGFWTFMTRPGSITAAEWVSHLWFLIFLAIYSAVAYAIYRSPLGHVRGLSPFLQRLAREPEPPGRLRIRWSADSVAYVVLLPAIDVGSIGLLSRVPGFGQPVLGFLDTANLAHCGLFFLLGMYFYHRPEALDSFSKPRLWLVGVLLVASAGAWVLMTWFDGHLSHALALYLKTLYALWVSMVLFYLFRRFCSRPSRFLGYLAMASYSVYLFHHLTIVCLGLLLTTMRFSVFMKFTVVVGLTFAITLAIHHFLIVRFRILRLLFNGQWARVRGGAELRAA